MYIFPETATSFLRTEKISFYTTIVGYNEQTLTVCGNFGRFIFSTLIQISGNVVILRKKKISIRKLDVLAILCYYLYPWKCNVRSYHILPKLANDNLPIAYFQDHARHWGLCTDWSLGKMNLTLLSLIRMLIGLIG